MEAQAAFTRRDLETALIEKCWKDAEFKRQVISDPKACSSAIRDRNCRLR